MKTFQRTKIYKGNYEIREYEWEDLLKNGQSAKFALGRFEDGEFKEEACMYVNTAQIRQMQVVNTVIGSQSGQAYLMRSIKWKPHIENLDKAPTNVMMNLVGTPQWEELRKKLH